MIRLPSVTGFAGTTVILIVLVDSGGRRREKLMHDLITAVAHPVMKKLWSGPQLAISSVTIVSSFMRYTLCSFPLRTIFLLSLLLLEGFTSSRHDDEEEEDDEICMLLRLCKKKKRRKASRVLQLTVLTVCRLTFKDGSIEIAGVRDCPVKPGLERRRHNLKSTHPKSSSHNNNKIVSCNSLYRKIFCLIIIMLYSRCISNCQLFPKRSFCGSLLWLR